MPPQYARRPITVGTSTPDSFASAKLGDLAAAAGIKRIHILQWRDLEDVEAGGSEVHAAEVASRWANAGLDVLMRSSFAQGQKPRAVRDGYQVVRKAGRYLVFPRAIAAELAGRNGKRDALVEIWNGMPFFSPLWARGPRITVLHHAHVDMWEQVLSPQLARVGLALETKVAPLLYRRTPIVTLSPSSKADMVERLGLKPERIHVVPPGIDDRFTPGGTKAPYPLVVFVGRLMPVKQVDVLIKVLAEVQRDVPDLQARLVGTGPERSELKALASDLGADGWLRFEGRLDDDELVELYRQAWAVTSASHAEGWGMTLTEAAACGTPAVATRITGHSDAVTDGVTGLLADSPAELARHLRAVLTDHDLRARLSANALDRASMLTWDATAAGILQVLASQGLSRRPRSA
jgi:glycosyltransferase involved in cell wall biosynthesis